MMRRIRDILGRLLSTQVAWPVLLSVGLLCAASILALEATSPERAILQQRHILVGVAVLLLALIPHYQAIGRFAFPLMGGVTALLAVVLLTPAVKGSRRWFALPMNLQLQPSELAKIAFVLALAWYLRYRKNFRQPTGLVVPFLLMLIPLGLILVEPDLGTALLFPIVLYAMLIAAGARIRHLLLVALLALVVLPGAYPFLHHYQQLRVRSFADSVSQVVGSQEEGDAARAVRDRHLRGEGFHLNQSLVAIGSGGAFGQGIEGSDQIRHNILPEAFTDFIFAVVGTQWGFVGALLIVLLYLAFFAAAMEIAGSTKDPFGRLTVVGLASMVLAQAFINMAMTTGLLPVVGIALPFLSYGGSSLVTSMLAVGLILNVSLRRTSRIG